MGRNGGAAAGFLWLLLAAIGAAPAAAQVASTVRLNEVESQGAVPGDWVEIYNPGPGAADVSGFTVKDNDDTHVYVIPAGTVIPAGGYLIVEEPTQLSFRLGGANSVRLFDTGGRRDVRRRGCGRGTVRLHRAGQQQQRGQPQEHPAV